MTKIKDTEKAELIQIYTELASRMALASRVTGTTHEGSRNLDIIFGYPVNLTFADYYEAWKRNGVAKAVINRPIRITWSGEVSLMETNEAEDTKFEAQWKQLYKDEHLRLKNTFIRLDKLTCIGRYGVLLFGWSDVQQMSDFALPAKAKQKLLYVKAYSETRANIHTLDKNTDSPRFGLPLFYEISPEEGNSYIVHFSRMMHVAYEPLDSDVYGTPMMEGCFNNLIDLKKLVGGSAEMFWRGARPGYSGKPDKDYIIGKGAEEELMKQLSEYEHGLRRFLINEGVDLKELAVQVSSPKDHIDAQYQVISAETGIPKRILTGSERGELASSQDSTEWAGYIQTRREEFAEYAIVRPFVSKCIEYGLLIKPTVDYTVLWKDLHALSDAARADIGKVRASAIKEYTANPQAEDLMPAAAFLEICLGLSQDQITLIEQMRQAALLESENEVDDILEEDEEIVAEEDTDE